MINQLLTKFLLNKKKFFIFSIFFALSKGAVFLAPLILSNILDINSYGSIEYALTFGSILAVILDLGISGAYPYFILVKKKDYTAFFYFFGFILLSVFIINLIFYNVYSIEIQYFLGVNLAIAFALQRIYSSVLKTHEKSGYAVIIDGGFYIVLLFCALCYYSRIDFNKEGVSLILYSIVVYILLLGLFFLWQFIKSEKEKLYSSAKEIISYGIQLVGASFLFMFLTGSGRILIEYCLSIEDVGLYSFYFRIASAIVLIHQFINIVFFKKIYITHSKLLDKYFSIFIGLCIVISLMNFLFFPILGKSLFILLNDFDDYSDIFLQLCVFTPLWIGVALMENIIYRENLAKALNIGLLGICLIYVGVVLGLNHLDLLDLLCLVFIHTIIMAFVLLYQLYILYRNQVFFRGTLLMSIILLLFSITSYLFY